MPEAVESAAGGDERPTRAGPSGVDAPGPGGARRLGSYELRRLIGAGGMGLVYEAVQDNPSRLVVVKVLNPLLGSAESEARFEREVRILAQLRHPGIAQVHEAGAAEEAGVRVLWFAMEHVPGARPITSYARERGLATRERLELFGQACDALHHAHERGVVHRDVKPGNMLVDREGAVKVIDFGVARSSDSDRAPASVATRAGELVGTLRYMAPEQCGPDPSGVDRRTDVYALGLVLYELASGRIAVETEGLDPGEAVRRVVEGEPRSMASIDPALGGDLETVVRKAIEKRPDRRYSTARELAEDVRRAARGEPVAARRTGPLARAIERARRSAARAPLVAFAVLALVAGVSADTLGGLALFEWTRLGLSAERAMTSALPPTPASGELRSTRVVTLSDATEPARLAIDLGLTGYRPDEVESARLLHARLLERLAAAAPRVIVFDLAFVFPSRYDVALAGAMRGLGERGIDVVVGSSQWPGGEGEGPRVSPALLEYSRWGGMTMDASAPGAWPVDLAVQSGFAEPWPSIALLGAALYRTPGAEVALTFDRAHERIEVRRWRPAGGGRGRRIWLPVLDIVRAAAIREEPADLLEVGLRRGDITALGMIRVPDDAALARATVDMGTALRATDDELRALFAGKAVVVGDVRDGRDRLGVSGGRTTDGCHIHAAALESLLAEGSLARPTRRGELTLVFACAASGVGAAGLIGGSRRAKFALVMIAMCAALVGGAMVLVYALGVLANPSAPVVATMLGCAAGALAWPKRPGRRFA